MANRLALKIFSFSISLTEADPIAQVEFFFINFANFSLSILVNFFESLISFFLIFFLRITAAAYTGPIKLPLPTSSTPAIIFLIK